MSHLLIAVVIIAVFFIAGMLVMRRHAARIEQAVTDFQSHSNQAIASIKTSEARIAVAVGTAQAVVGKAAVDIKAAMKNPQ